VHKKLHLPYREVYIGTPIRRNSKFRGEKNRRREIWGEMW
jgi:hypothetical protein